MAAKAPTKLRKPAPVVEEELDDEEDLEEEIIVKPVKRSPKTAPVAAKPTKGRPVAVASNSSARYYVEQVLLEGAPQDEVKKRAVAKAKKDGSAASFKTFNVPYFINLLVEKRGYKKRENNGVIKLVAPRA